MQLCEASPIPKISTFIFTQKREAHLHHIAQPCFFPELHCAWPVSQPPKTGNGSASMPAIFQRDLQWSEYS